MHKPFLTLCLLLFSANGIQSQNNLSQIQLDIWACCDLNTTFKTIEEKYHVNLEYDSVSFSEIRYNNMITTNLADFLNQICRVTKTKYYVDTDNTINIVSKWQKPENIKREENKTVRFTGPPSKYNFKLSGKVTDKKTGESLPFVSVALQNSNAGTSSNNNGFFTLLNVPSDTVTLHISYLGYQKLATQITPNSNVNSFNIELETEIHNINEVTITGDKQDILQVGGNQVSMYKMSPKKLNAIPNLGEKDILRSFQLMPGISAANENSSGLYVRGGTPDQVLVLYDGFTVYNVEHMFGFFSAFNSNAIKDVQLYKGGFEPKYGGRLASVLEITGKEGNQKEFNGGVDLSLMSLNGHVEFPVGQKVSAIISARRSWKSPLYDKIFDQFTEENQTPEGAPQGGGGRFGGGATTQQETKSYFYDVNAKVTYKPSSKDVIAFSLYNGQDNLDNSIIPQMNSGLRIGGMSMSIQTTDKTNWGNTGASLTWSRQWNDRLYISTLASSSNYFSTRERSSSGSFTRQDGTSNSISRGVFEDNNLKDITGKVDVEYKLTGNNQLMLGAQYTNNNINYTYAQNDTLTIIDRSTTGITYSAYLQDRISLFNNKLTLTPGVRYNYFTPTSQNYYEPRINAMYKVNPKIKLKGSAGQYYQFAKRVIREDITQGSRDFWVLSDNDKLPVSGSQQYILGISYETPRYLFDVESFYKDLQNITEYSLRIEANRRSVDYSENFFTGTGIARGIDFLVQKKRGKLTGWIGYTLSQTTNNIPEFGDYDFYASHDVTHEFKTVATYKWRNWDFGANWIYATGRPYTSPEGAYTLSLLDGTTADYINVSVKNGNRIPDYHRLDVSATLNFKIGGKAPASIGFSMFNVYNRANVWYNEYEVIDSDVIETPVYYLGITPNLNFTLKFK